MSKKIAKWILVGLICVLVPCLLNPETFWQRFVVMVACVVVSVVVAESGD